MVQNHIEYQFEVDAWKNLDHGAIRSMLVSAFWENVLKSNVRPIFYDNKCSDQSSLGIIAVFFFVPVDVGFLSPLGVILQLAPENAFVHRFCVLTWSFEALIPRLLPFCLAPKSLLSGLPE